MPYPYNNFHYSDMRRMLDDDVKVVAIKHRSFKISSETQTKKEKPVVQNLNTIAAIMLDDNLVSVTGSFANFHNKTRKTYTYKCLRSVAETLKKNDLIVVEKKGSEGEGALFTVVFVVDVHDTLNIDPDDGINYAYVVSKIDTGLLDVLQKAEDDMVAHIKRKRREVWKQQLVHSLVTPELEDEKKRATENLKSIMAQAPEYPQPGKYEEPSVYKPYRAPDDFDVNESPF